MNKIQALSALLVGAGRAWSLFTSLEPWRRHYGFRWDFGGGVVRISLYIRKENV